MTPAPKITANRRVFIVDPLKLKTEVTRWQAGQVALAMKRSASDETLI
ncbi:hypothetical protein BN129_1650 [Cronobacter sakazakii 701]|nr:hypothetical protein BN129_1650 [Cronobacter sakazakii 701]